MNSLAKSFVFIFFIVSCTSNPDSIKSTIHVDLSNAVIQQIFNFQNARNSKAILPFLTVDKPSQRYVAAMALASVQDSSSIIDLAALLKDEYEEKI